MKNFILSKPQRIVLIFLVSLLLVNCGSRIKPTATIEGKTAVGKEAMVVTAHPEASRIGVEILDMGGNAVDAMVGVHFALAVVYPSAGNLGGGGFMMYRQPQGGVYSLDFREMAPMNAYEDMYLDEEGEVIDGLSLQGPKASGVPGSVDGMLKAHKKFGSLPLSVLIAPAINLAKSGFEISAQQARNYNYYKDDFIANNQDSTQIPLVKPDLWKEGDLLVQNELAATLTRIQKRGRAGFYEGETAALLVAEMKAGNGIIELKDLKEYKSRWRQPVKGSYKGVDIYSMGPPSSGGIALMQLLKLSQHFPLSQLGHQQPETVHLIAEMERRVYADRATHLGDSDFWEVPFAELLDEGYLQNRVDQINPKKATPSGEVRAMDLENIRESEETTHYSIIDKDGHAVSVTTTINSAYGSKVFVSGAGFLMNNEMDDFSSKPGVPNIYGLLGGEANAIKPGKRMLSAMTPTLLEKDGKLLMVVGTPGGSTIITSVFQVILNVLDHGMSMSEAVAAKRFHHQWKPDQIFMEAGVFDKETERVLIEMGHDLKQRGSIGRVDAILVKPDGTYEGAADPRGDDWAVGF